MRISDWSSDVCSSDLHRINTGFVHAAVDNGVDFAAHIDHVGAIHDIVSVLIFGGPAKNQAGRAAVIDAELALQAVGGFLLKIGRASCRGRVCEYVWIAVVA